jgi:hypothetical protein
VGRSSSALNTSEVNRILKLVAANGWAAKLNGKSTYLLIPPEGDPMPLRQSSTGKYLTFAQLRARGVEADQRKLNRPDRNRRSERPYTPPLTEWDKYALPSMATDRRTGKPLPVGYKPSHWANSFRFSSHAKTRIRERNAHEWECYAALDLQDFAYEPKRDGQAVRCYVRGDLIVVVDAQRRRIVTVVDTNSCLYPSVPRVMYAPVPTENPVTKPTENAEPAAVETRPWQNTTHPLSFRTRFYLADQGTDRDVSAQEIIEALDAVPGRVYSILSRLIESGLIRRVEEGRYRPIDIDGLGQVPERGFAAQKGQANASKVLRGDVPSMRSRLLEVMRTLEIGALHTVPELRSMIGEEYGSTSNLYTLCRDMAERGFMTEYTGGGNITEYALRIRPIPLDEYVNTHRRILQDELMLATGLTSMNLGKILVERFPSVRSIGPRQWVNDAVPVHSGPELTVVEPEPEPIVVTEPEPEPEPVVEPEPEPIEPEPEPVVQEPLLVTTKVDPPRASVFGTVDIDVDSAPEIPAPRRSVTTVHLPDPGVDLLDPDPVAVGFEFMALPASAIYPMAAAIVKNLVALHEHRGQWARIASYAGTDDNAEELARKQAAEVAAYLGDATLQFAVRWETELHIGVFVRVRPA